MDRHQVRIEAAYLSLCSHQAAYDWLKEHAYKEDRRPLSSWDLGNWSLVLEKTLLAREDPLIDLGIARFGNSTEAIEQVYQRGNIGVRCAALSNPHVGPILGVARHGWLDGRTIELIIESNSSDELQTLCTNAYLDEDALEYILERKEVFSKLSDEQYLKSLEWLSRNTRMSRKYDSITLDGGDDYSYHQVFGIAWELSRTLPANNTYAYVLEELLRNTLRPTGFENIHEVLDRWRFNENEDQTKSTFWLRSRIADLLEPDEKLLKSDDPALRASFFRRFQTHSYPNWPNLIQANPDLFDQLLENNDVWECSEERAQLSKVSWKLPDPQHEMGAQNEVRVFEARKRHEHPDWFRDQDEEFSSESDAVTRRIEKKIDDLLDLVNVDLVDQNLHQKLTPQKVVPTWVWAVGMFVAGFVIVRLFFKF